MKILALIRGNSYEYSIQNLGQVEYRTNRSYSNLCNFVFLKNNKEEACRKIIIVWVKDFDRNKFQNNEFLSVYNPVLDLGVGVMIVWMLDPLDELDQLRPIQNFRPNQVPTLFGLLLQRNSFFWNLFLSKSLAHTIFSHNIFSKSQLGNLCWSGRGKFALSMRYGVGELHSRIFRNRYICLRITYFLTSQIFWNWKSRNFAAFSKNGFCHKKTRNDDIT